MNTDPKTYDLNATPAPKAPISSAPAAKPEATLLLCGAMDAPLTPGTLGRLDRFEILRLLGEGGMGLVYLAREPLTETMVAIKIVKPNVASDPQAVHRFLTEARHMYQLSHPRILRVLEVSNRKEGPYYVMPYIAAGSLLARYQSGQLLPEEQVLAITRQVAEALAHAHAHGLIHRDLKPGNVLVDKSGNAYLTDFGLVRTVFNDSLVDAAASHLEGTAPYMSPAVARGEAEDTRCDIYAFGALLYELLTGQPPYTGRTPQMIIDQVLNGPPKPILAVNPKADPGLVKIAEGCLARELHSRYAAMKDVVTDLHRVEEKQAPLGPHRQGGKAHWPWFAAIAAGVLIVAVLAAVALHQFRSHAAGKRIRESATLGNPSSSGLQARKVPVGTGTSGAVVQTMEPPSSAQSETADTDSGADLPAKDSRAAKTAAQTPPQPAPPPFPPPAAAAPVVPVVKTQGPFTYTVTNGTATVTKYTGPGGKVDIPAKIDGVPVTCIGPSAFENCVALADVIIPNGLSEIGDGAFRGCSELAALVLPKTLSVLTGNAFNSCAKLTAIRVDAANPTYWSDADGVVFSKDKTTLVSFPSGRTGNYTVPNFVTTIGYGALAGSRALTGVVISPGVRRIEPWAFADCSSLISLRLPNSITSIGEFAFWGCSGLPEVTIPDSVTDLGYFTFAHCHGLKSVRIPQQTTNIGPNPFRNCGGLTAIEVEARNPAFCSVDGVLFDKQKQRLVGYPTGRAGTYRVPDGVTAIDQSAFRGAGKVTCVVLPASVTFLGYKAFIGCGSVGGFFFSGNVPGTRADVFAGCGSSTLYYRAGATGWGKEFRGRPTAVWDPDKPFTYSSDKGAITITRYASPEATVKIAPIIDGLPVTAIGRDAFRNCRHMTSIEIPDSVTYIAREAFFGCVSLTGLNIPDSVVRVEQYALNGCNGLTAVRIPAKLANLEAGVFQGCSALAKVVIPEAVTGIADVAFNGCSALATIDIPANVATVGGNALNGCSGLRAITVNQANRAFNSVDGILLNKDKTILVAYPRGRVGDYAIPDSVTAIGRCAFETCAELTGVVIPGKVTSIGDAAFRSCRKLATVKFSDSLTSIGVAAFQDCVNLAGVTLPAGIVSLRDAAFYNCPGITEITIPASVTEIGNNTFPKCQGLTAFKVADGNPAFSTVDGVLFDKARNQLVCYPAGRKGDYVIPAGTRSIRPNAFERHPGLTGVTVAEGVERIEAVTFIGCPELTTVTIPASVRNIGNSAFSGCTNLTAVCFGGDVPTVDKTAFAGQAKSTVYYRAGTKGWDKEFGGRPTAVWDGKTSPAAAK